MNLGAEEAGIIARLEQQIPELPVLPWPKLTELGFVKGGKGDILVQFVGGSFGAPEATPQEKVSQQRDGRWRIVARSVNLSPKLADENAYGYLERVRKALTGFTVPGVPDATKLYPIGPYGFMEEKEGVWYYGMTFALSAPEVES
jgi:hypothetical protein